MILFVALLIDTYFPQVDDIVEDVSDDDSKSKDADDDITKDSLIKAPKKKKTAK